MSPVFALERNDEEEGGWAWGTQPRLLPVPPPQAPFPSSQVPPRHQTLMFLCHRSISSAQTRSLTVSPRDPGIVELTQTGVPHRFTTSVFQFQRHAFSLGPKMKTDENWAAWPTRRPGDTAQLQVRALLMGLLVSPGTRLHSRCSQRDGDVPFPRAPLRPTVGLISSPGKWTVFWPLSEAACPAPKMPNK